MILFAALIDVLIAMLRIKLPALYVLNPYLSMIIGSRTAHVRIIVIFAVGQEQMNVEHARLDIALRMSHIELNIMEV